MKNKIFKDSVFKRREVGPGLNGLMKMNEKILRGIFWGVSLAALILSMVNFNQNAQISKTTSEIISTGAYSGVAENASAVSTENKNYTYEQLNSVIESQLGENVSEYVSEYITEYVRKNEITDKITEKDIVNIKSEISEDLIKKVSEGTTLTDKQELIVRGLVSSMISDIKFDKIDYDKIDKSIELQVTKLVNEKTAGIKFDKVEKYDDNELRSLITTNANNVSKNSIMLDGQKTQINNIQETINNQSKNITLNSESIADWSSQANANATNIAENKAEITKAIDGVASNADNILKNSTSIKAIEDKLTSDNGVEFKFGIDKGVYGYYVNDVFYPF